MLGFLHLAVSGLPVGDDFEQLRTRTFLAQLHDKVASDYLHYERVFLVSQVISVPPGTETIFVRITARVVAGINGPPDRFTLRFAGVDLTDPTKGRRRWPDGSGGGPIRIPLIFLRFVDPYSLELGDKGVDRG